MAYRAVDVDVGDLVAVHRDRAPGCLVALPAGFVALFGVWMLAMGLPAWQGGAYLAVAAVVLVAGRRWSARRASRIELHRGGLVARTRGDVTTMRFDDVETITRRRRVRYRYGAVPVVDVETFVLATADGRRVELTTLFERADALVAAVEEAVVPRLRTKALRAFPGRT